MCFSPSVENFPIWSKQDPFEVLFLNVLIIAIKGSLLYFIFAWVTHFLGKEQGSANWH